MNMMIMDIKEVIFLFILGSDHHYGQVGSGLRAGFRGGRARVARAGFRGTRGGPVRGRGDYNKEARCKINFLFRSF